MKRRESKKGAAPIEIRHPGKLARDSTISSLVLLLLLVVYNINPHAHIEDDVKNIRDAFPQTYVFHLPDYGGLVVVGSMATKRLDTRAVRAAAEELDRRFRASYSFKEMAMRLER